MLPEQIKKLVEINKNVLKGEMLRDYDGVEMVGTKVLFADCSTLRYVMDNLNYVKIVEITTLDDSFDVVRIQNEEYEILKSMM